MVDLSRLSFEEATHSYRWDGAPVRSVTQVIGEFMPPVPQSLKGIYDAAGDFGQALHKTVELRDTGKLATFSPELTPWLESWDKFRKAFPNLKDLPVPKIEFRVYSPTYNVAGTIDRILLDIVKQRLVVVDMKTGHHSKSWEVQVAAYAQILKEVLGLDYTPETLTVRLLEDRFELAPKTIQEIEAIRFWSMLNLYEWRKL